MKETKDVLSVKGWIHEGNFTDKLTKLHLASLEKRSLSKQILLGENWNIMFFSDTKARKGLKAYNQFVCG